jgi:hypothetical protein
MIEVALAGVGALNGFFFYLIAKHGAEERRRLLAAVMAKDPAEFVALERATAPKKRSRKKQADPVRPIGL